MRTVSYIRFDFKREFRISVLSALKVKLHKPVMPDVKFLEDENLVRISTKAAART